MQNKIILAPMLGITDQVFRGCFAKFFPGFDEAYAPFIKVNQLGEYKASKMRELLPSLNSRLKVTPQIMCNHSGAFLSAAQKIAEMGYENINWNLGCPSPSSSSRTLGCGLMPEPELVDQLLNEIFMHLPMSLSIKTRLGLSSPAEMIRLAEVFNRYPIDHIIIHPRTGNQGYRGHVDLDAFEEVLTLLRIPVYLSGDISSEKVFFTLQERFPNVKGFLIGRGALSDPLIGQRIKNPSRADAELDLNFYCKFINELYEGYLDQDLSIKDISIKMRTICFYLAERLGFSQKKIRKIRKAKLASEFEQAICEESQNANDCVDQQERVLNS